MFVTPSSIRKETHRQNNFSVKSCCLADICRTVCGAYRHRYAPFFCSAFPLGELSPQVTVRVAITVTLMCLLYKLQSYGYNLKQIPEREIIMQWNEDAKILEMLEQYKRCVNTQKREDFYPIWSSGENVLISQSNCFVGTDAIYDEFIIGRIQKAYSKIELISKTAEVRKLTDDTAVVVFEYVTDCTRRESGEPFALGGLETQVYVREQGEWKLAHVQYSGRQVQ